MIKEITSIQKLEEASEDWMSSSSEKHLSLISPPSIGRFNKESVRSFIFLMLKDTISKGEILPYIKIWSYEELGSSVGGCCFVAKKDPLTGLKIFEEFMWQTKGSLAESLKEKKIMLKLLKNAEIYAKNSGLDVLILSRDPSFHKVNKDNDLRVENYYTRNNFSVCQLTYAKKLK